MMDFPQYRRYKNGLSYFKITSESQFTEIKRLGKNWDEFHFVAKILPDRNFIQDMLYDYQNHWDEIEELEFIQIQKLSSQKS